jgi:hypothetical protein
MSEFDEFLSLSNPLEQCSDHFAAWLCQPVDINNDHSVWLDGARPPLKYILNNNMTFTNSKIQPT